MNEKSGSKVCALVSGGLDSFVLLDWLLAKGYEVWPVYVRSGVHWEGQEVRSLAFILDVLKQDELQTLKVLDQPVADVMNEHWSVTGSEVPAFDESDEETFLPGRNILLLSKAAVYCSSKNIEILALGCLGDNPFPDASANFLTAFGVLLAQGLGRSRPFTILEPFADLKKESVIQAGIHLPLDKSFSCLSPAKEIHCGRCNKCAERQRGFQEAAVPDLTKYQFRVDDAFRRETELQS